MRKDVGSNLLGLIGVQMFLSNLDVVLGSWKEWDS